MYINKYVYIHSNYNFNLQKDFLIMSLEEMFDKYD